MRNFIISMVIIINSNYTILDFCENFYDLIFLAHLVQINVEVPLETSR
jgi:hypothetical protein